MKLRSVTLGFFVLAAFGCEDSAVTTHPNAATVSPGDLEPEPIAVAVGTQLALETCGNAELGSGDVESADEWAGQMGNYVECLKGSGVQENEVADHLEDVDEDLNVEDALLDDSES